MHIAKPSSHQHCGYLQTSQSRVNESSAPRSEPGGLLSTFIPVCLLSRKKVACVNCIHQKRSQRQMAPELLLYSGIKSQGKGVKDKIVKQGRKTNNRRYSDACVLTHIRLFVTPWTAAYRAPLSIEFSRQEYWNGLPLPSPRNLPLPGIEPTSVASATLADGLFIYQLSHWRSPP